MLCGARLVPRTFTGRIPANITHSVITKRKLLGRPTVVGRRGNSQYSLVLWISSNDQELRRVLCFSINKNVSKGRVIRIRPHPGFRIISIYFTTLSYGDYPLGMFNIKHAYRWVCCCPAPIIPDWQSRSKRIRHPRPYSATRQVQGQFGLHVTQMFKTNMLRKTFHVFVIIK